MSPQPLIAAVLIAFLSACAGPRNDAPQSKSSTASTTTRPTAKTGVRAQPAAPARYRIDNLRLLGDRVLFALTDIQNPVASAPRSAFASSVPLPQSKSATLDEARETLDALTLAPLAPLGASESDEDVTFEPIADGTRWLRIARRNDSPTVEVATLVAGKNVQPLVTLKDGYQGRESEALAISPSGRHVLAVRGNGVTWFDLQKRASSEPKSANKLKELLDGISGKRGAAGGWHVDDDLEHVVIVPTVETFSPDPGDRVGSRTSDPMPLKLDDVEEANLNRELIVYEIPEKRFTLALTEIPTAGRTFRAVDFRVVDSEIQLLYASRRDIGETAFLVTDATGSILYRVPPPPAATQYGKVVGFSWGQNGRRLALLTTPGVDLDPTESVYLLHVYNLGTGRWNTGRIEVGS